jgi:hypothetical protein
VKHFSDFYISCQREIGVGTVRPVSKSSGAYFDGNIRLETAGAIVLDARQAQTHKAGTNLSEPPKKIFSPAWGNFSARGHYIHERLNERFGVMCLA